MSDGSAEALRDHLRRVGAVKAASELEDEAFLRELSPGERLARGIALSDGILALFPPPADAPDDEAATWERVNRRLARVGR